MVNFCNALLFEYFISTAQRDIQQTKSITNETADSQLSQKNREKQSPTKMTDFNDNTNNRPQWNAAVSQDGAEVTRPEMANLITGLDDDPFGERAGAGGQQQQYQYSKTETTVTNQGNTRQEPRSPSGGRNFNQQQSQQSNTASQNFDNNSSNTYDKNDASRYESTRQKEDYNETEVRNRRGNQEQGQQQRGGDYGRRDNDNYQEKEESSYQTQQKSGGQQQQQRGEQRGQQQQGGGYGRQEKEELSYQEQRGGEQEQQRGEGGEQGRQMNMDRLRSRVSHSVNDVVMWRDVVHS